MSFPSNISNNAVSSFPRVKPFSIRKPLSHSYQALGACFKPYKAFDNLKMWVGNS